MHVWLVVAIISAAVVLPATGDLQAGVVKVDATLPIGTPLAGFNHGARRVPFWPLPEFTNYTTWMTGSTGVLNPTWVKALVLTNNNQSFCFVTLDGIGSGGHLNAIAYDIAAGLGFSIPFENCMFSSSHTHSGPAAISPDFLWAVAPATDLLVPALQRQLATSIANAMVAAEKSQKPAVIDLGSFNLTGVTKNRRAKISPYVNTTTIDPHLGVIRVDDASDGSPIATVWNFAIHGVCYGPDNLNFSSDIMGRACDIIEETLGGVALFINADAGDIDPADGMCNNAPNFTGSPLIAKAVVDGRSALSPTDDLSISATSLQLDFGPTNLNYTLSRFDNCNSGGPLDICSLCAAIHCDLNVHLPSSWIENTPIFSAFRFTIREENTILVSIPGEGLLELGWQIRNDTMDLGYNRTFLCGYSNNHLGYFATPNEYDIGGYESQLTFWGIDTSNMIRSGCYKVASALAP